MSEIGFQPKNITKKLVTELPERARDVIVKRFGLTNDNQSMTLEAIGSQYGITRERVRQIENHALNKIRQSDTTEEYRGVFDELEGFIRGMGIVVAEDELLSRAAKKRDVQNHVYFLLTLGEPFYREKENSHLKHRWHVDHAIEQAVQSALIALHDKFDDHELVSEDEIIQVFRSELDKTPAPEEYYANEEVVRRWLNLAHSIDKNPLGEWGRSSSPNVRVKGMRDYAYLVIRSHGSPMHFTEVTKRIQDLFGKKAHIATTHNELIKDDRFVLVGRGLYALAEWGYMRGVVKDVIEQIISKYGPLSKDEIVDKVLKERYVKPNTVLVNLQDPDRFKRSEEGLYLLNT